jgi:endonuclease YncB( thermonuclease family)
VRSLVNGPLLLALTLTAGLFFYHAWYRPRLSVVPLTPLVGHARVVDGDSLELAAARVRLDGIDAPELGQSCRDARGQPWPCGRMAAQELRRHVGGRQLRCEATRRDRYHRMVATCSLPDGSDLGAWMVRQGWALAYGRGAAYRVEQGEARLYRRGLWAGSFAPPWEWRHRYDD